MKGSSMPNLISKFNENTINVDDCNWTEDRFLTADQCLAEQNSCNGEPDWLGDPPVVFDSEAEAAYKDWQASLFYLEQDTLSL
jgi:hypothetical protein